LHKNNRHIHGYNFDALVEALPALKKYIIKNTFNQKATIDFSDPIAVKLLNFALLKYYYKITQWDIPEGYLCPAIPGRVDYIHYLKDLLDCYPKTLIKLPKDINVLDIGSGASCIYPLLGQKEYRWRFITSDIDPISISCANNIIAANHSLKNIINCRLQGNSQNIFRGIIKVNEFYHLTMCNPPFHKSFNQAQKGSVQKWKNLKNNQSKQKGKVNLNFGGQEAELFCQGGELQFIQNMIKESKEFKHQVLWFTCLVSNRENLSKLKFSLKKSQVTHIKVINMSQGHKISRFIAWSYHEL
jgi:23S rRNA (adenine1618-N6)-methyltransferase